MKNIRPFLKWPGGKYRLLGKILDHLPQGKTLIEPFVGGGAVFLNSDYSGYLLNDANQDLITLYQLLKKEGVSFIETCKPYFTKKNNSEKRYYVLRKKFNESQDPVERSALFLYLNRHGYNGLCRYNARKGEFNVPFGSYLKPYFPEEEMYYFHEKAKKAKFISEDFTKTLQRAKQGSVVYCDPPYVPLSVTAQFTNYRAGGFSLEQHEILANEILNLQTIKVPVLVSNHSTEFTRKLYCSAMLKEFEVQRYISAKSEGRRPILELLAFFQVDKT
jgi:DNA adenine methylase